MSKIGEKPVAAVTRLGNIFKIPNYGLVKPKKGVMAVGAACFSVCMSYLAYKRYDFNFQVPKLLINKITNKELFDTKLENNPVVNNMVPQVIKVADLEEPSFEKKYE